MDKIVNSLPTFSKKIIMRKPIFINDNTIVVLFLFIGAIFIGPIRRWITDGHITFGIIAAPDSILPLVGLCIGIIILLFRMRLFYNRSFIYYFTALYTIVIIYMFSEIFRGYTSAIFGHTFIAVIMFCVLWFGILSDNDKSVVFRSAVTLFYIYLVVNVFYWIIFLDPLGLPDSGLPYRRMGGSLATVVHLGAIIPAFCAFCLTMFERVNYRIAYLEIAITSFSLLAVIATGSRTGALLMIVLLLIIILSKNNRSWSLRIFSIIIIIVGFWLLYTESIPGYRFLVLDLSEGGRTQSWMAAIEYWKNNNIKEILFGSGWGKVYPYWNWVADGEISWGGFNWFFLGSKQSLVSPHNSLLWVLVEGGVFLFLLLCSIIMYPIIKVFTSKTIQEKSFYVFGAVSLVILFNISDVLLTSPSTSMLSYMILILSAEN